MDRSKIALITVCALLIAICIGLESGNVRNIKTFTVKGVCFSMVEVEGGTFMMGATAEQEGVADTDEKPAHKVKLSKFSISQTEVTQELWEAVMGNNPSKFKGKKRPVEGITRAECLEFIKKLNKLTHKKFRLPTEAEWEYAARGGKNSKGFRFSGSNTLEDVGWFDANSFKNLKEDSPAYGTHDVATKHPNELGIYDMSGNVWEFCQDVYADYSDDVQKNPLKTVSEPTVDTEYVDRGGSWNMGKEYCRVTYRDKEVVYGNGDMGIRLVLK